MRRLAALVLPLFLLACAPTAGSDAPPSIDWRTQVSGGDLLVRLADRRGYYRVERVSLVAPSGRTYPAFELTREVVRDDDRYYPYGPGVGVGGSYGSGGGWSGGGVGVGVSVPLGESARSRPERGAWTEARIPLPPEPRSLGPDWKIVVEVSDPSGAMRIAELPAPTGD